MRELCAISETPESNKNSPLNKKYAELFQVAKDLRGQRDILHRYGLPSSTVDWSLVWATFDSKLEKKFLPPLDKAIEGESEAGLDEDKRKT